MYFYLPLVFVIHFDLLSIGFNNDFRSLLLIGVRSEGVGNKGFDCPLFEDQQGGLLGNVGRVFLKKLTNSDLSG